jgi:hypothetical protein
MKSKWTMWTMGVDGQWGRFLLINYLNRAREIEIMSVLDIF